MIFLSHLTNHCDFYTIYTVVCSDSASAYFAGQHTAAPAVDQTFLQSRTAFLCENPAHTEIQLNHNYAVIGKFRFGSAYECQPAYTFIGYGVRVPVQLVCGMAVESVHPRCRIEILTVFVVVTSRKARQSECDGTFSFFA